MKSSSTARKLFLGLAVGGLLALLGPHAFAESAASQSGFRALSGAEAAALALPGDMKLVRSLELTVYGLRYERYQQVFGAQGAYVLGGQLTFFRTATGQIVLVIGAHYPDIVARNEARLSADQAQEVARRDVGAAERSAVQLSIDPASGRYFFRVETSGFATRWVHWVDATTGNVVRRYDALETDHGAGVKGDTKDIDGPTANTADDLTTDHSVTGHGATGAHWDLTSKDNRQVTYDKRNKNHPFLYYVTDPDNHWTTLGRTSPGQPALIDAQFYANTTDDYFVGGHSLDWLTCYPSRMQSVAHYGKNYNNAFWNGTYTVYGDGDGSTFRELSGGLDVVAHEHTHGVTDCTSQLIYSGESGALNESFSDILGSSAEFFAGEPNPTNCVRAAGQSACADWWIGEDVYLPADTVPGFRNMADPQEDGDPDHYSERYTGSGDNGGVHTNSAISNHAYYLLVNGGQNAGCDAVGSDGHQHAADCDVNVAAISLSDAERIFFLGFTGLNENATFCNARDATVTASSSLFGAGSQQRTSTMAAWEAVGVTADLCAGGGSEPTPTPTPTATPTPTPTATASPTPTPSPSPTPSYYTTVLNTAGLVSYWRLGEASGTVAADEKNANPGSYVNSPTLGVAGALAGDPNTAVALNSSGQYVNTADLTTFDGRNPYTLAIWVNHVADGSGRGIFGKWSNVSGAQGTGIADMTVNGLRFERYRDGVGESLVTTTLTAGWHFVVATYDGTTMRSYVDAVLVGSLASATSLSNTSQSLQIGWASPYYVSWNGSIDEAAVYSRALSAAEILSQYQTGCGC